MHTYIHVSPLKPSEGDYINVLCLLTTQVSSCVIGDCLVSQVEEMKLQLRAAHEEEQRALVAKMEVERSSEVTGLKAQYEAELHGLKEELARVQREGEEIRRSVEQQLSSETCRKQVGSLVDTVIDTCAVCVCVCMCYCVCVRVCVCVCVCVCVSVCVSHTP